MAAVIIAGGRFHRQIDQPELFVYRDLRPNAGVAGVFRRSVHPSVVARLALHRDGMEDPEPLAGADIEAAHVAFVVAHALRRHAFAERRAHDHRVLRHHGRRLQADLASSEIGLNRLIVVQLQIDRAVFAERFHRYGPSSHRARSAGTPASRRECVLPCRRTNTLRRGPKAVAAPPLRARLLARHGPRSTRPWPRPAL